jgi:hypothetical protein
MQKEAKRKNEDTAMKTSNLNEVTMEKFCNE